MAIGLTRSAESTVVMTTGAPPMPLVERERDRVRQRETAPPPPASSVALKAPTPPKLRDVTGVRERGGVARPHVLRNASSSCLVVLAGISKVVGPIKRARLVVSLVSKTFVRSAQTRRRSYTARLTRPWLIIGDGERRVLASRSQPAVPFAMSIVFFFLFFAKQTRL